MRKLFICLANSKKYNQRCIAGIELKKSTHKGYKYEIVRQKDNPVWIRPVSDSEYGEISSELVEHIHLLDIVEINVTAGAPQGYQSENVLFDSRSLQVVGRVDKTETLIDKLLAVDTPTLFGNTERVVHADDIGQLDHSLMLIKPSIVRVYKSIRLRGNPQTKASFLYGAARYDLPVTDIDFEENFAQNLNVLRACTRIYFTVSLGIEYYEQHYKLVAGILYF